VSRPRVHTRRTRQGIELRVDGTLASLVQPGTVITGPVWNALAAPFLALPPPRLRRVLMLGFGGGSVARVARALAPDAAIVGVEHDRAVVEVARRELGIDALGVELVIDDALAFLARERRTFDVVVEDLIVGPVRSVRRSPALLDRYELVRRRVARGGVLVLNTIHDTPRMVRLLARAPGTIVKIGVKGYYNDILAWGPPTLAAHTLRGAVRRHPLLRGPARHFAMRTVRR
jgi:spermidine synthase